MLIEKIKSVVPAIWNGINRRQQERVECNHKVHVQPLDEDRKPNGAALDGTTRNVSHGGVGLVLPVRLECRFVQISIPDMQLNSIGIIRYQHILNQSGTVSFLIGIELTAK